MNAPKSESFWLALLMGGIAIALLVFLTVVVLCVPWRSNIMVMQLPEKKPVPVIKIPEEQKPL